MNTNPHPISTEELDAKLQAVEGAHSAVLRALIEVLDPATAQRFSAACSAGTQAARLAYTASLQRGTIERHFDVVVERTIRG